MCAGEKQSLRQLNGIHCGEYCRAIEVHFVAGDFSVGEFYDVEPGFVYGFVYRFAADRDRGFPFQAKAFWRGKDFHGFPNPVRIEGEKFFEVGENVCASEALWFCGVGVECIFRVECAQAFGLVSGPSGEPFGAEFFEVHRERLSHRRVGHNEGERSDLMHCPLAGKGTAHYFHHFGFPLIVPRASAKITDMKKIGFVLLAVLLSFNAHAAKNADSEFVKFFVELDYGICLDGQSLCGGDTIEFSPLEIELVRNDHGGMKVWASDWIHEVTVEGEKFTFRIRTSHYIFADGKERWNFFPEIYRRSKVDECATANIDALKFEDLNDVQLSGTEVKLKDRTLLTWLRFMPFSKKEDSARFQSIP